MNARPAADPLGSLLRGNPSPSFAAQQGAERLRRRTVAA